MGKFLGFVLETIDNEISYNEKVEELTDKLMRNTYGVDRSQATKIARLLVAKAEITWK